MRFLRQIGPWAGLALVLAGYAWAMVANFTPAYLEPDPDGYVAMAKRMAEGLPITQPNDDPFRFHSHVWVETPRGVLPKFAPGYPVLMAPFYARWGDEGLFFVSPIMGGLGLLGSFLLFRLWMRPGLALIGTLVLAINGPYLFYSAYMLTHASDMALAVCGMYGLWRWGRSADPLWGAGAGLLLGYACMVRHTSALLALPVAVTVVWKLWEVRRERPFVRPLLSAGVLCAAYAAFPCVLAWYNRTWFGSVWTSGYALSGEQGAFSVKFFPENFRVLSDVLSGEGLFMFFALGLAGVWVFDTWRERTMAALWLFPVYLAYGAYYWATNSMAYGRFLLGVFPLLVGAGLRLLDQVRTGRGGRVAAMAGVMVVVGLFSYEPVVRTIQGKLHSDAARTKAADLRAIRAALKPDAVIFAQDPLVWQLEAQSRFRVYSLQAFNQWYGLRQFPQDQQEKSRWGRFEPRRQADRNTRLRAFYQVHSNQQLREMKLDIIRSSLERGLQVAFVIAAGQLRAQQSDLVAGFEMRELCQFDGISGGKWGVYALQPARPPGPTGRPSDKEQTK